MSAPETRPFLVVTGLVDSSARPAAITRSHGDAVERAYKASEGRDVAGIDLAELPISGAAFSVLRKKMALTPDTVALYDVFPLPARLDPEIRRAAGQFLAAEGLWLLEGQALFDGVPPNERLELPPGWGRTPQEVQQKLMEAGAHDLGAAAGETYRAIKLRWDEMVASAPRGAPSESASA